MSRRYRYRAEHHRQRPRRYEEGEHAPGGFDAPEGDLGDQPHYDEATPPKVQRVVVERPVENQPRAARSWSALQMSITVAQRILGAHPRRRAFTVINRGAATVLIAPEIIPDDAGASFATALPLPANERLTVDTVAEVWARPQTVGDTCTLAIFATYDDGGKT